MFSRILVPIDVSDPDVAAHAIEVAGELAKTYASAIRLVAVVNLIVPVSTMDVVPQTYYGSQGEQEHEELDRIAKTIPLPDGRVSSEVREGGTYPELLAAAEAWTADLIVVGAHRHSMATYLLGSTAAAIVRHAKCPVLVLRGETKASVL